MTNYAIASQKHLLQQPHTANVMKFPYRQNDKLELKKKKNVHFILFNFTILRNVDCAMIVQERNKSSPWKWKSFDFELIIYINN